MLDNIISVLKNRIEYMKNVGGFPENSIKSRDEIIEEMTNHMQELEAFKGGTKQLDEEFRRKLIEFAASILFMIDKMDNQKGWEMANLMDSIKKMNLPDYKNGGFVPPRKEQVFGPGKFTPSPIWPTGPFFDPHKKLFTDPYIGTPGPEFDKFVVTCKTEELQ